MSTDDFKFCDTVPCLGENFDLIPHEGDADPQLFCPYLVGLDRKKNTSDLSGPAVAFEYNLL